jgi:hypothetical protein
MKKIWKNITIVCALTAAMLACELPGAATPAGVVLPPTLPPLVEPLELKYSSIKEDSQAPIYTITADIPYLDPATHPAVQAFNTALKSMADAEIAAFKGSMAEMPETPISAGSSLDIKYASIGQKGNIWSLQYNVIGYADGAAHPYHYTLTFNYDLQNIKQLTLDDIFTPGSNYLQMLSDISKSELTARNIGFDAGFQKGAEPTAQNYRSWNLSNEGFLVITFDEGQVAAYAAGPQVITIPFSSLTEVLNVQGPAAPYLSQ